MKLKNLFIFNFKNFLLLGLMCLGAGVFLCNLDAWINRGIFPYKKNSITLYKPDPRFVFGINGDSKVTANSFGLRGPEFGNEKKRVLVLGNSLAECAYLDDSESWPQLLQDQWNAAGFEVAVFNAARSGELSAQRITHLYNEFEKFNFDLVIVYPPGIWNQDYAIIEGVEEYNLPDWTNPRFSLVHNVTRLKLKGLRTRISKFVNSFKKIDQTSNTVVMDQMGETLEKERIKKRQLPLIGWQEDRQANILKNYQKGLIYLKDFFKGKKVKTLFIEELNNLYFNPTNQELEFRWGNHIKIQSQEFRYSFEDELRELESKSQIFEETMNDGSTYFLSIKAFKSFKARFFYDQHHFNEEGAINFSNVIQHYVQDKKLL